MPEIPYSPVGINRKISVLWLTIPTIAVLLVLLAFTLINALLGGFQYAVGGVSPTLLRGANYFLGIVGMLAVIAVPVGFIVAIFYTLKDNMREGEYDGRSGMGEAAVMPEELKGWNWGAAGLGYLWGFYYRSWLTLFAFVPVLNFVWWIAMGLEGNRWAWEKNSWHSVEEFRASQKKWRVWGMISLFISLFALVAPFFFSVALLQFLG